MKRDQSSKRVTRSMSKQIKDESTGAVVDPRNAMFAAIKSRGGSKVKIFQNQRKVVMQGNHC